MCVSIPRQDLNFQHNTPWYVFMLNELTWNVYVRFVDIGEIIDRHYLNFLFINECHNIQEKFENTKGMIQSEFIIESKLASNGQINETGKNTTNCRQNTTQKIRVWAIRTSIQTRDELICSVSLEYTIYLKVSNLVDNYVCVYHSYSTIILLFFYNVLEQLVDKQIEMIDYSFWRSLL